MLRRLFPSFLTGPGAIGLLLIRLVMGSAFILHGWPKMQNATGWMNPMGGNTPGWLQAIAALTEFGGGIAIIMGLLTPLASLALVGQMLGALFLVHLPHNDPFVAQGMKPSYESSLLYLALAVGFLTLGPGRLSLDALLFGRAATATDPEMTRQKPSPVLP